MVKFHRSAATVIPGSLRTRAGNMNKSKPRSFLRSNKQKSILAVLIIAVFIIFAGFITFYLSLFETKKVLSSQIEVLPTPTILAVPTSSSTSTHFPQNTFISKLKTVSITTTLQPSPTYSNHFQNTTTTSALTPINQVQVSINGGIYFSVDVEMGSNQCDVLSNALNQGKISSLNMQFNSSYGSYGVYQINGIGKENQVWWTYLVNGDSPSSGCSYIKANNDDSVSWKYIGPDY